MLVVVDNIASAQTSQSPAPAKSAAPLLPLLDHMCLQCYGLLFINQFPHWWRWKTKVEHPMMLALFAANLNGPPPSVENVTAEVAALNLAGPYGQQSAATSRIQDSDSDDEMTE